MLNINAQATLTSQYSVFVDQGITYGQIESIASTPKFPDVTTSTLIYDDSANNRIHIKNDRDGIDAYFDYKGGITDAYAPQGAKWNIGGTIYTNNARGFFEYTNGRYGIVVSSSNDPDDAFSYLIQAPTNLYEAGVDSVDISYKGIGFSTSTQSGAESISRNGFKNANNKGFYVQSGAKTYRFNFND